ncbi:MAG TPA: phenylalanine--tRNA ligase subunit beta [Candidatus Limnocylindrales bacterium]|jgi:phenylalanyl-tRNA synthetase beta chain
MKVPLSWLRDYVDIDLTPEQLAERLTLLGMEVQSIDRWGGDWQDVVVGELLTVSPHPRADRLSLTTVTIGDGEPLEIVCGATNIAVGQRVPVALPGAVLPGGRRIGRAEKMGVVSNGMLCSGEELRLTSDADGILILAGDAPLGRSISELYGDVVLDVDVKPNRGDALSLIGLAREVSAATGAPVRWPSIDVREEGPDVNTLLHVEVVEQELCPRFVGRVVNGLSVGPSPDGIQMRLQAANMRPVNNVVDASNYAMVELGKPTHTFDAAAVHDHRLIVRRARAGERLETLDHVERDLDVDTLVIADPSGVLAIAGVMGGASSEVSDKTRDVIIESAIFDPVSIRRTGQRYGLRSEASLRFEKGQETRLARIGADRVAALVGEWADGTIARGRVDTNPSEPEPARLPFRPARVNRLTGTDLSHEEQRSLLDRVGIATEEPVAGEMVPVALDPQPALVEPVPGEALVAILPTWRRDLAIEADIAEEVTRIRGYDLVPGVTPHEEMPHFRPSPLDVRDAVRQTLAGAGFTEVVSYALVSPRHVEAFRLRNPVPSLDDEPSPGGEPITVTNPLSSQHSVLRTGLIGSLVEVVASNRRHGRDDVAAFEVGKGYAKEGDQPREWWRLGIALAGSRPGSWDRPAFPFDLDDAKGAIDLVARRIGLGEASYSPELDEPIFHPGRTARISAPGLLGIVGELHPAVTDAWDVRAERVIVAELALRGLSAGRLAPVRSVPPPRYPAVERDLAVIVAEDRPMGDVVRVLRAAGGDLLRDIRLFDVYRGAPLASGEKSVAFRLAFQAEDRTLTEGEIDRVVKTVAEALGREVGGRLRT